MSFSLSVIIPVYNRWDLTEGCLESLSLHTPAAIEVIVVDNCSTDDTPQACPALGAKLFGDGFVYLRQSRNLNFARACNLGAKAARSELLFFLNNDTILQDGWLPPLLSALQTSPHPAVVAPMLLYPHFGGRPNRVQHIGVCFDPQFYPTHLYEGFPASHPVCRKPRRFQALTGAALMLSQYTFIKAGLFDEDFINGGEDVELGVRLSAAGHILTCIPESAVYHLASQTPGIHAHGEYNARKLKEKALVQITPDLHFFAEKDGYELALTPRLTPYLDLPERRKEILAKRVAAANTADELEALIEREPLCHAAYLPLACLHEKEGRFQVAADTVFLALKLRQHPELAERLLFLAQAAGNGELLSHASSVLSWYGDANNLAEAVQRARHMADFTQQLGMEKQSVLYRQWLANKDTIVRLYSPGHRGMSSQS